ncbi:hypothetical protein TEA_007208 [Camellia sinensis var. sinensis]|uniref:Uncharacterized protein n=1 Tax=Camellia sinensis var. sinensis TaxID=542762 RepID=A0A4S4ERM9_CAMSN|nr:hypothetical protein TEA_007208 [Camellia sinensis var. sinensis]
MDNGWSLCYVASLVGVGLDSVVVKVLKSGYGHRNAGCGAVVVAGCKGQAIRNRYGRYGTVSTAIAVATADTPVNVNHTAKAAVTGGGGALKPIDVSMDTTYDVTEHYWFPMLAGLSDLTSDPRPEVRNCALEVLFDLLNERGSKFSSPFWQSIFHRVLFPIFDHVRHAGKESSISSGDEWLRETSIHSLQLLCNLFNTFYKEVCFMLPPLLSLLLDCAKKTDQAVVSISLGALVHLIEVGGHQFSDSDWDTLLKGIRDASYTTQPLELLNALGFENSKNHTVLNRDFKVSTGHSPSLKSVENEPIDNDQLNVGDNGDTYALASLNIGVDGTVKNSNTSILLDHNQELSQPIDLEGSEGVLSPSGRSQKRSDAGGLQRNQTIGQRIMGNMMDNLFVRSFTTKSKNRTSDVSIPSSPSKECKHCFSLPIDIEICEVVTIDLDDNFDLTDVEAFMWNVMVSGFLSYLIYGVYDSTSFNPLRVHGEVPLVVDHQVGQGIAHWKRGRKVSTTECHQPRVKVTGLNVKRAAQLGIARGANERKKTDLGRVRITAEYFDSAPFTLKDFKNATLQVEWIKEPISKVNYTCIGLFADVVESESDAKDEDESPLLTTIRSKCITQLLLLGAIDSIQKKYWNKLKSSQKIAIMDILFSVLEFAASYNSYTNLRLRMHHIPAERPPLNLLRQELAGTCIYLDILHKTTSEVDSNGVEQLDNNVSQVVGSSLVRNDSSLTEHGMGEKLETIAEEKLVSFCGQVLKEASDFQSSLGETTNMDIHRVLELRSPIIVKVLKGMCFMNSQIFRKHLRQFYPFITKLVCCDQMDVRGALGDLFGMQLSALLT